MPAATFSEELRAEPACSSAVVAAAEQEAAAGPVDPVAPAVERAAGPAVWPVAAPARRALEPKTMTEPQLCRTGATLCCA